MFSAHKRYIRFVKFPNVFQIYQISFVNPEKAVPQLLFQIAESGIVSIAFRTCYNAYFTVLAFNIIDRSRRNSIAVIVGTDNQILTGIS